MIKSQVYCFFLRHSVELLAVHLKNSRWHNVADIFTDQIHVFLTALNQNLIALLFIY